MTRGARAFAELAWARPDALLVEPNALTVTYGGRIAAVRPTPRPLPDAQTDDLRALLARRRPLVAMRTAERTA